MPYEKAVGEKQKAQNDKNALKEEEKKEAKRHELKKCFKSKEIYHAGI